MKYILAIVLFFPFCVAAQDTVEVKNDMLGVPANTLVEIYVDSANTYTNQSLQDITKIAFKKGTKKITTYLGNYNNLWLRCILKNKVADNKLYFDIDYANISDIEMYRQNKDGQLELVEKTGNSLPFKSRKNNFTNFVFGLDIPYDSTGIYYFHFTSIHPLQLPISIHDQETLDKISQKELLIVGIYSGIIISILLYNFFLFFSTKDESYFFYVLYLFSLLLALLTFSGWSFKFLWPSHPQLNKYAVIVTSMLPGVTALVFALSFLRIKQYSRLLVVLCYILIVLYCAPLIVAPYTLSLSYSLLTIDGIAGGLLLIFASGYISWKGYRPALYYFFAWFVFAVGRQILSLRNLDVLPYNNFTTYILYIGSAIEAILLSLALADRINIYKKEREESQAEALRVSKENERLVRDQNIILEKNVAERTEELIKTNHQLNDALVSLKDAQTQLVDAEKMASLGQLTAGIAHEINNPINFVKSNINPLKLDIKDIFEVVQEYNKLHALNGDAVTYKKQLQQIDQLQQQLDLEFIKNEVGHLIQGIEDGAERTAEIVRGLRTFSRLDESELKVVNVHDGIESTIVLIRNNIPFDVQVIKNFNANGEIECYPGKLNQVFMNILTNGLQAIAAKTERQNPESITITTRDVEGDKIEITIKDSGIGMSDEVKHRVFEPFFTTKDVGEGTGLGMAIVFKIIEKHHGKIAINSAPGKGAEFILTLPHTQPIT
ncbi:MAG TPA: 7TM diverse intracellular signaling domain-containing protein [Chitinophagaceae bacterium]|nr:7TM diverse intracellular signaling domain-containing protein [Chitinophagaceae bacterium]